jgi:hypothetical protein
MIALFVWLFHGPWLAFKHLQSFFDTVNQEWLIRFVEHRIGASSA